VSNAEGGRCTAVWPSSQPPRPRRSGSATTAAIWFRERSAHSRRVFCRATTQWSLALVRVHIPSTWQIESVHAGGTYGWANLLSPGSKAFAGVVIVTIFVPLRRMFTPNHLSDAGTSSQPACARFFAAADRRL
jgi:hypothetical protein